MLGIVCENNIQVGAVAVNGLCLQRMLLYRSADDIDMYSTILWQMGVSFEIRDRYRENPVSSKRSKPHVSTYRTVYSDPRDEGSINK